eukprot:TRINITY_DN21058_c0_g2_i1.p1 TRINITY_DN21058_c0_g2~~TRINITY_DN21058_c0_g2_i1.p1  ORF type:complete len:988 (-),score=221.19 TRINITY_DN21058_c0_g2_i1:144-3107(-)
MAEASEEASGAAAEAKDPRDAQADNVNADLAATGDEKPKEYDAIDTIRHILTQISGTEESWGSSNRFLRVPKFVPSLPDIEENLLEELLAADAELLFDQHGNLLLEDDDGRKTSPFDSQNVLTENDLLAFLASRQRKHSTEHVDNLPAAAGMFTTVCRPPGAPPTHQSFYRPWHWRTVGVYCPPLIPSSLLLPSRSDHYAGNESSSSDSDRAEENLDSEDSDDEQERAQGSLASATIELIAALGEAKRSGEARRRAEMAGKVASAQLGGGRAARAASVKRAQAIKQQKTLEASEAVAKERRNEERERISMAQEDLAAASAALHAAAGERLRRKEWAEKCTVARRLQCVYRQWKSRKILRLKREMYTARQKQESQQMWQNLRANRPVRLYGVLSAEMRDIEIDGESLPSESSESEEEEPIESSLRDAQKPSEVDNLLEQMKVSETNAAPDRLDNDDDPLNSPKSDSDLESLRSGAGDDSEEGGASRVGSEHDLKSVGQIMGRRSTAHYTKKLAKLLETKQPRERRAKDQQCALEQIVQANTAIWLKSDASALVKALTPPVSPREAIERKGSRKRTWEDEKSKTTPSPKSPVSPPTPKSPGRLLPMVATLSDQERLRERGLSSSPPRSPREILSPTAMDLDIGAQLVRETLLEQLEASGKGTASELVAIITVRDKYLECCKRAAVKPNSQVLRALADIKGKPLAERTPVIGSAFNKPQEKAEKRRLVGWKLAHQAVTNKLHQRPKITDFFMSAARKPQNKGKGKSSKTEEKTDNQSDHFYDFTAANIGDRGVVCLLCALALDPFCAELSLRACGLRGATVGALCNFIELHPRLRVLDLAHNSFSLEAGEQLLKALNLRAEGLDVETSPPTEKELPRLVELSVDLGGTCLDWGAGGPPCGTIWADEKNFRGDRLAPAAYERLRKELDETKHVKYYGRVRSDPTKDPSSAAPADAAASGKVYGRNRSENKGAPSGLQRPISGGRTNLPALK